MEKDRIHHKKYAIVGSLFILGLVFRLFLMLTARFAVSFDEAHYLRLGASFLERGLSGLLHAYWPPFFPCMIALVGGVVRDLELAGRLISVLSGALLVFPIYRLGKALVGDRAAKLAALFVMLYPPLAYNATNVMPETLYSLVCIVGIYTGWKALDEGRPILGLAAGLLWGAGYLMRPEGVGFVLVYGAFMGILLIKNLVGRAWNGRFVLVPILSVVGFLLLAMPYVIYLRQATGVWTLSTKGRVNQQLEAAVMFDNGAIKDPFLHLTPDNQSLPYDMAVHFGNIKELASSEMGRSHVMTIPLQNYVRKYVTNFYRVVKYAVPHTMTSVLFILWAVGFFHETYDSRRWKLIFYLAANVVFFWFLLVPMFHVNDRYLMPLFPLCFIWVGQGCLVIYDWIVRVLEGNTASRGRFFRHRHVLSGGFIWIAILAFSFLPELGKIIKIQKYSRDMWSEPVELKEAGHWLKAHTDHPPVLMSLNKAVDYYAGQFDMRKGASFSYDSVERNLAYARHRGVDYLVLSSRYLEWFSNLRPFIESQNPSAEVSRIYDKTDPSGVRTVIYRMQPDPIHSEEGE
jgi:4-amino-4-deoxy-L-arabinose transferase-like glycosyltransferase